MDGVVGRYSDADVYKYARDIGRYMYMMELEERVGLGEGAIAICWAMANKHDGKL